MSGSTTASSATADRCLFEARTLHLWRGDNHLLRGVSFSLGSGELLQVTGPNGAGKTSLLRVLCGLLPAETGEVLWRGEPISRAREAFHRELIYLAHLNALKPDLTADENLRFASGLRRPSSIEQRAAVLERLGVARCAGLQARVLSAGQRRRVAFARVLLSQASLWVLDEPTTNLDANGVDLIQDLMRAHLHSGGSIVAAAHHALLVDHPGTRRMELG